MLTTPITTPHFQSSVQNLISSYYDSIPNERPVPLVPALKPLDSPLIPSDSISQLVMIAASWIDLASPDPVIANISQQVLNLEVAYAAFCGVQHLVIQAPSLHSASRITQYARAIQEALAIGSYMHFHILLPIAHSKAKGPNDPAHLSHFARMANSGDSYSTSDWSPWEAWNAIRQFCTYSPRLSVGKNFGMNSVNAF